MPTIPVLDYIPSVDNLDYMVLHDSSGNITGKVFLQDIVSYTLNYNGVHNNKYRDPIFTPTGASHTLLNSHEDSFLILDHSSDITLTLPNLVMAYGSKLYIMQKGAGKVNLVGSGGTTIIVAAGSLAKSRAQNSVIGIKKIAHGPDTWVVFGDLEQV